MQNIKDNIKHSRTTADRLRLLEQIDGGEDNIQSECILGSGGGESAGCGGEYGGASEDYRDAVGKIGGCVQCCFGFD